MMSASERTRTDGARRLLIVSALFCGIALAIFAMPASPALAVLTSVTQTTVADFNPGSFYHTGLTQNTNGGGDGNGEVRLMTVGISAADWRSDGNTTGLAPLQGLAAVQKNGRIYVSGGGAAGSLNGTQYVSYTTILSTTNHNLTNWTGTSTLPYPVSNHGMAVVNNYVYVLGGQVGLVPTSTVLYAPITSNGSLGSWTRTQSLPDIRSDFASVVVSGTIYVIGGGGTTNTPQSTVYYAKPNSDGTISSWQTASFPLALMQEAAAAYNGTIYVIGGYDGTTWYPDVYYATPDSTGNIASWTHASVTLQQNLILGSGASFGGQIYVAGGAAQQGAVLTNTIASNLLNDDGSPGSWVLSYVLSVARQRTAAVVSDDGWLYVIEGNPGVGIDPIHTIDYGPLSAPGSTYTPNGTFTSSIINLQSSYQTMSINWNAMVSNTVTMTLRYRMGNNPDLSDAPNWIGPFYAIVNSSPVTNTIDTSAQPTAQFVQYQVSMGASQDDTQSPVLNAVQIVYDVPVYPDYAITGMSAPFSPGTTTTKTITITVLSKTPTQSPVHVSSTSTQSPWRQPAGRFAPPPLPPSLRNSKAPLSANTIYYFWVAFYADPSSPPTNPNSISGTMNCVDGSHGATGTAPFIYLTDFGSSTPSTYTYWASCSVPANTQHFYAQIDYCPSAVPCNSYGLVLEKDELGSSPSYADNIFGPLAAGTSSGGGSGSVFLPYIKRSP
jgi:hypothetical protein